VPLAPGSAHAVSLEQARVFFAAQSGAGVMIKATGGGGGRGIRAVRRASDVEEAYRHSRQCWRRSANYTKGHGD
jgi:biotin carboxylase